MHTAGIPGVIALEESVILWSLFHLTALHSRHVAAWQQGAPASRFFWLWKNWNKKWTRSKYFEEEPNMGIM